MDPVVLEAVEVARGPGAVAYGSDAFGGVIQMRTRRAAPGTPFGGNFEGSLGAGTPQQRAAVALTKGFERGGLLLAGHYRNFENWTSPEGEVGNSGARDQGFLARFGHLVGGGLFSVAWQSDFGRDIERPRTNSQTVRFSYPTEDSHRLTLAWERGRTGAFSKVGVSGFLGRYALVTDQDRFASASQPRSLERADVSASDFHLSGYAQKPLGSARFEAGLDLNGRANLEALEIRVRYDEAGQEASSTEIVSIEEARRVDAGVYASVEAPVGRALSLSGGLRGDAVGTRNQGGYFGDRETDNGTVSGFAAVTAGPFSGFSATAQVARGFRDPTLSDRYYRGPTGRGFITGNPDLDPETSLQLDLTLRYSSGGFRAAVYAYEYRIDDLVERYQAAPDFFFFRNRGEARIRGIEAEVQARLPARFSLELTGHLLRGEALDDGTGLDGIPPATLTARLRRDFGRAWAWVRTAAYGRLDRPGPHRGRSVPGTRSSTPRPGCVSARPRSRLLGRNLLDEAYLVSPDSRAVLAPGLTGVVSLGVRFMPYRRMTSGRLSPAGAAILGAMTLVPSKSACSTSCGSRSSPCARCGGLGDGLAYTTVMTTLDRLYKKGLLTSADGRAFRYSARASREALAAGALRRWLAGFSAVDRRGPSRPAGGRGFDAASCSRRGPCWSGIRCGRATQSCSRAPSCSGGSWPSPSRSPCMTIG